jgi:hypothetical protein
MATRYVEGDVVEVVTTEPADGGPEFIREYAVVHNVKDPRSDSPLYKVVAIVNGENYEAEFNASGLNKVNDWELETQILLETYMEVEVNQTDYPYYEDMGAVAFEAEGTGVNGESEWIVFRSREQARNAAIKRVKQDLREQPEIFEDDFMAKHTYISESDKRMIAQEEARHMYEDISDEDLITEAKGYGLRADNPDVAREQLEQKKAEEIERKLDDPIQYFVKERGIYTQSELGRQDFTRMDVDDAAEEAVRTDGIGHFLDVYDFEAVKLENGALAYATN